MNLCKWYPFRSTYKVPVVVNMVGFWLHVLFLIAFKRRVHEWKCVYNIVLTCDLSLFHIGFYVCIKQHTSTDSALFYHVSLISFALLPCSPFSILLVAFPMQNIKLKLIHLVSIEKDTAKRLLRKRRKFFSQAWVKTKPHQKKERKNESAKSVRE